jgi:hypothetical protein
LDITSTTPQKLNPLGWVTQYKQQIVGKLEFASQVLGEAHPDYLILDKMYQTALEPPDEYESISWLNFNYV